MYSLPTAASLDRLLTWAFTSRTCPPRPNQKITEDRLVGLGAEFGQGAGPLAGARGKQDPLGDVPVGAAHPRPHPAQGLTGQSGRTAITAPEVPGPGRPAPPL